MKFIFTNQLFPKYYRQQKFETFLLIYFPMASEKKKNTDLASFFFIFQLKMYVHVFICAELIQSRKLVIK